jgi:predicted RNA binding protein YcfA (HicA-like mRNA interferase family)
MPKLTELAYYDIVIRLKKFNFRFYRQGKGSHEIWVRDEDGKVIPIPHYKGRSIRKGTVRAIINEIGVTVDEFMK